MSYSWLALNYLIDEELYFAFSFLVRKTGRAQSYPLKSRYCWLAMGIVKGGGSTVFIFVRARMSFLEHSETSHIKGEGDWSPVHHSFLVEVRTFSQRTKIQPTNFLRELNCILTPNWVLVTHHVVHNFSVQILSALSADQVLLLKQCKPCLQHFLTLLFWRDQEKLMSSYSYFAVVYQG